MKLCILGHDASLTDYSVEPNASCESPSLCRATFPPTRQRHKSTLVSTDAAARGLSSVSVRLGHSGSMSTHALRAGNGHGYVMRKGASGICSPFPLISICRSSPSCAFWYLPGWCCTPKNGATISWLHRVHGIV